MKKRICLLLCAILLIGLGLGAFFLLREPEAPPIPLYWNLDGRLYNRNTNPRTPEADGTYRMRFFRDGEVLTITVGDIQTVNEMDAMDVMGLNFDENGGFTGYTDVKNLATTLCVHNFVRKTEDTTLSVNSSPAMNGVEHTVTVGEDTLIYDLSLETPAAVTLDSILPLDEVSAYADMEGNLRYLYVLSHPTESSVYWRVSRKYSSKTMETTREPDENGIYSLDFYCDGALVTLQAKDKAIVTQIDADSNESHFGLTFDADGYINGVMKSPTGIRGLLVAEGHDITAIENGTVTAPKILSSKGENWTGTLREDCVVYDISPVAKAENRLGEQVEGVQVGDRVTVWTDTENRAIQIYVTNRLVDSPAYFSISRKFDSNTNETTRTPDDEGYYTIPLLKEGDSETTLYKTKDKDIMSQLDSVTGRCVGLEVTGENEIRYVYPPEALFGYTAWSNGSVVSSVIGSVVTRIVYGKPGTTYNGVMMPDCKIYNASTTGQYGAETTLRVGDYFYAFRQPSGEVVHIYVVRRDLGADTMYYNLDPQYNAEAKATTRQPDADGFYHFTLAHNGEKVNLKTQDDELATKLDSFTAVSLLVEGDVILEVNDPKYATGGSQVAAGNRYTGKKGSSLITVDAEGTETKVKPSADCVIYDARKDGKILTEIPEGSTVTIYTNRNGEAQIIFVW